MLGLTLTDAEKTKTPDALQTLERHDTAYWLFRINEASVVANVRRGLLPLELARAIRDALRGMEEDANRGLWCRPQLYIAFEPELLKRCGMEASLLHVGRSSQDILATAHTTQLREALLILTEEVEALLATFLTKADEYWDTIIPLYTNGVQAQPSRYSHYLYAQAQSWGRQLDRLYECLTRYDACAMGSAVLNGTVWPLDQTYMSTALGFSTVGNNAFDVVHLTANDLPCEASQIVQSLMLNISNFLQDFMVQYAQTRPWVTLSKAGATYISSAMPQKRNPGLINDCRRDAGVVFSAAQGVSFRIHNICEGMADVRDIRLNLEWITDAYRVINTFRGIVEGLHVDRTRALEELNSDWTCTQNIADELVRVAGIPFRQGHHFASVLVTWARKNSRTPANVTYSEIVEVWHAFVQTETRLPTAFPFDQKSLAKAMDPATIVETRKTIGGPQESDMERQKVAWTQRMTEWTAKRTTLFERIQIGLNTLARDLEAL